MWTRRRLIKAWFGISLAGIFLHPSSLWANARKILKKGFSRDRLLNMNPADTEAIFDPFFKGQKRYFSQSAIYNLGSEIPFSMILASPTTHRSDEQKTGFRSIDSIQSSRSITRREKVISNRVSSSLFAAGLPRYPSRIFRALRHDIIDSASPLRSGAILKVTSW
jgi:hypothetical protein